MVITVWSVLSLMSEPPSGPIISLRLAIRHDLARGIQGPLAYGIQVGQLDPVRV